MHSFFPLLTSSKKNKQREIRNKQEVQALQIEPCYIITKNGYIKNNQREKKKQNWDKEEIVPKKRKGQMMGLSSPRFP